MQMFKTWSYRRTLIHQRYLNALGFISTGYGTRHVVFQRILCCYATISEVWSILEVEEEALRARLLLSLLLWTDVDSRRGGGVGGGEPASARRDGSRVKWSQNWGNSSVLRMREFLLLVPRHQPVPPPLCRRRRAGPRRAGCRCRMCVSPLALSWVTVTDKTKAFVAWLASAFFNVKKDWKIFKVMSSICLCAVTLSFWAIPPVSPLGPY